MNQNILTVMGFLSLCKIDAGKFHSLIYISLFNCVFYSIGILKFNKNVHPGLQMCFRSLRNTLELTFLSNLFKIAIFTSLFSALHRAARSSLIPWLSNHSLKERPSGGENILGPVSVVPLSSSVEVASVTSCSTLN